MDVVDISHNVAFSQDTDGVVYSETASISGISLPGDASCKISDIDVSVSLHDSNVVLVDSVHVAIVTVSRNIVDDLPGLGGSLYVPDGENTQAYNESPSNLNSPYMNDLLLESPLRWGWYGDPVADWSTRSMLRLLRLPGVNVENVVSIADSRQSRREIPITRSGGYLLLIPFLSYLSGGAVWAAARVSMTMEVHRYATT